MLATRMNQMAGYWGLREPVPRPLNCLAGNTQRAVVKGMTYPMSSDYCPKPARHVFPGFTTRNTPDLHTIGWATTSDSVRHSDAMLGGTLICEVLVQFPQLRHCEPRTVRGLPSFCMQAAFLLLWILLEELTFQQQEPFLNNQPLARLECNNFQVASLAEPQDKVSTTLMANERPLYIVVHLVFHGPFPLKIETESSARISLIWPSGPRGFDFPTLWKRIHSLDQATQQQPMLKLACESIKAIRKYANWPWLAMDALTKFQSDFCSEKIHKEVANHAVSRSKVPDTQVLSIRLAPLDRFLC